MKWLSTYRGYEIRHSTVRDGDGFARYDAEIRVGGEWRFASCEALDDDTIERELDAFINELQAASPFAPTAGSYVTWPAQMVRLSDGLTRGR